MDYKDKIDKIRQEKGFKLKEISADVLVSCPPDLRQWLIEEERYFTNSTSRPDDWNNRTRFIRSLYNYTCQLCKKTENDSNRSEFHTHHIIPLSECGDNSFDNLVCLCRRCHQKQHPFGIFKDYD